MIRRNTSTEITIISRYTYGYNEFAFNPDKAFERRFLYKIRFNNPTIEAQAEIWQNMIK